MEFIQTIKIPVALAILLFAGVSIASVNLDGWQYHKNVIIKENSGNTLTDYQILINLSGADFPNESQSDGRDIRFTGISGNLLPYWIEGYNATTKTAKIWVKVPRIPANGTTTLQMHYGNASASAMSNGTATFEFFDDFEGYTVGSSPSTWTQSGNTAGRINDAVRVSGNKSFKLYGVIGACWANLAHRPFDMQPPYYIDFDVYNGNESLSGCHPDRGGFQLNTCPSWTTNPRSFITFRGDGTISPSLGVYSVQQWYNVKMRYEIVNDTTIAISYWINDVYKGLVNYPKASYESDLKYYTIFSQEGSAWFDNTILRKAASIEPTVTIENVSESWLMLSTDKKNYLLGENIILGIVVNYTGNPVFVQFKLELQEPYGAIPDTLIKTDFIPLTAGVYKKVSLSYPIPVSPLILEGEYTFIISLIDGFGNIIASDATSIYINDSMPSSLVREFI